jgi:hypothetical protein
MIPERVLTLPSILEHRIAAAAAGKRVVLTNGCFDLLHRGHVTYLEQSASLDTSEFYRKRFTPPRHIGGESLCET